MTENEIRDEPAGSGSILFPAVLLALVVSAWNLILAATGLYTSPMLGAIVLVIELAGLAVILVRTARRGYDYRRQVLVGLAVFFVVGVGAFASGLISWTVLAPDYLDVITPSYRSSLERAGGMGAAEIEQRVSEFREYSTPMRQSFVAFSGTLVRGLLFSLVLAIMIRSRSAPEASLLRDEGES